MEKTHFLERDLKKAHKERASNSLYKKFPPLESWSRRNARGSRHCDSRCLAASSRFRRNREIKSQRGLDVTFPRGPLKCPQRGVTQERRQVEAQRVAMRASPASPARSNRPALVGGVRITRHIWIFQRLPQTQLPASGDPPRPTPKKKRHQTARPRRANEASAPFVSAVSMKKCTKRGLKKETRSVGRKGSGPRPNV